MARYAIVFAFLFSVGSAARLDASTIQITFTGAGMLTYLQNPATTNPAADSFSAAIVSPQYGSGTISVPDDFTNYITATGHANVATIAFGSSTITGSNDSVLNLMTGTAGISYNVTGGTGVFGGAMGTIVENAQFTSFGSFSPNVPANVLITSASGTLTNVIPEPGTVEIMVLGLGLVGGAYWRRRKP